MKKTLIALAALAATGAFAQNVTITGVVDVGVKAVAAPTTAVNQNNSRTDVTLNNIATSAVKFLGTEDLGGGMKAGFLFEINPNPVQSTTGNVSQSESSVYNGTPFNGEQFVSLEGGFGLIKAGNPNSVSFLTENMFQPYVTGMGSGFSTSFGRYGTALSGISSQVNGTTGSRIIRHERTAQYQSPSMSGFKVMAEYAFGNDQATVATNGVFANEDTWMGLALHYNNGPLNVGVSTQTLKYGANPVNINNTTGSSINATNPVAQANTTFTWNQAGGNYTFGKITGYAGWTQTKNSDSTIEDASSWNVGGKFALSSAIDLSANYLVRTNNLVNGKNGKVIGLGADYNMSKRTTLYVRAETIDTDTNIGTTAGGSVTAATAFGIRHAF
jgi:predicted porin